MATLLSSVTSNVAGTGASHTGPATVFVRGAFDGAVVVVQVSDDNTNYVKADNISPLKPSTLKQPGVVGIDAQGTYYIRCVVSNAGSSTSISAVSTQ